MLWSLHSSAVLSTRLCAKSFMQSHIVASCIPFKHWPCQQHLKGSSQAGLALLFCLLQVCPQSGPLGAEQRHAGVASGLRDELCEQLTGLVVCTCPNTSSSWPAQLLL